MELERGRHISIDNCRRRVPAVDRSGQRPVASRGTRLTADTFADGGGGYGAQWGEESPMMGTFTYRMLGFTAQPVDHYLRTFYMVAERRYRDQRPFCSGSDARHRLMLRAMRHLVEAYPSRLKFSFLFHSEYTHGSNSRLQWADDDLRDHLDYLLNGGHLERSLLVLMSDHGARFQVVRSPASLSE